MSDPPQQVHGPRIEYLIGQAPPQAWQRLSAGHGAKGDRFCDWAAARLPAIGEFDGDQPTRRRWMLARRSITKPDEIAYYLAWGKCTGFHLGPGQRKRERLASYALVT
ncbi:hypothetical protein [Streptomyces sp. LS1784]|uniref:hypothetical protein n=1 Tax=Streptomyces sp. LS1784 TaxID=2851533 RepID=UPI001CCAFE78|nr:hypothetical protein [Streptomyces sp. LS1784]